MYFRFPAQKWGKGDGSKRIRYRIIMLLDRAFKIIKIRLYLCD